MSNSELVLVAGLAFAITVTLGILLIAIEVWSRDD